MFELHARHPRLVAALRVLCVVLASGLWIAPTALGQKVDRKQQAGQFFSRGVEHFEAEEYEQALRAFEQAYRLAPHHAVRVNMAACFAKLGRPVEALFNYERFMHESEGGAAPAQQREVQAAIAELEQQVGEVELQVSPESAQVQIEGKTPRRLPDGRVMLAAGNYQVDVFAPGYVSERRTLQVQGGQPSRLEVTLQPTTAGGTTPVAGAGDTPAEGGPWSGFEAAPSYEEKPLWARPKTRRWIASVGVALMAGSVVSGALIAKYKNDRDAALERAMDPFASGVLMYQAQLDAQRARDQADTARATTLALMSTGLALEAAALTLWLVARNKESSQPAARLVPHVAPGYAGISLSGAL